VWILSGTQQKLTLIRRRGVAFDEAASVFFDPLAVSGSEPDHSAQSPFFCMNDEWQRFVGVSALNATKTFRRDAEMVGHLCVWNPDQLDFAEVASPTWLLGK